MTPSYPTASLTRSQGMVFHRFSGDPVTRSKRTHQWMSGVTMLVRWLCSFPASELLALVGLSTFVLPRPQEMHPSATNVNQQAASCPRSAKAGLSRWSCCHWILQGMHPTSRRFREGAVGPSFSQRATSRVPGYGGEDLQNDKKQRQRQATNPEENRPRGQPPEKNRQRDNLQITKLGDDQERRPLSQVAQNERERVIGQHEEKKRSG